MMGVQDVEIIDSVLPFEDTLPLLPSALLETAMNDLEAVERDPTYRVDMGTWHTPRPLVGGGLRSSEYVCCVCLGGAVMAGTLKVDPRFDISTGNFPDSIGYKLSALDAFRTGAVTNGLLRLQWVGLKLTDKQQRGVAGLPITVPCSYFTNPTVWKASMRRLVEQFRSIGL